MPNNVANAWQPGRLLELQSERFLIRSLRPEDASERYVHWWNDAEVQASLNMPVRNWTRAHAIQHIGKFDNQKQFHLGIFPKGDALPIGFFTILMQPNTAVATTNVVIGEKDWWGKAVPKEVRITLLPFIFLKLKAEKVKGVIHGRNLPSIFNYEVLGFKNEGILRSEAPAIGGRSRIDIYHYGLLKADWERSDAAG